MLNFLNFEALWLVCVLFMNLLFYFKDFLALKNEQSQHYQNTLLACLGAFRPVFYYLCTILLSFVFTVGPGSGGTFGSGGRSGTGGRSGAGFGLKSDIGSWGRTGSGASVGLH